MRNTGLISPELALFMFMFLSQERLSGEGVTRQAGFYNLDVCVVDSIYIKSYHPAFPKALLDLCTCASLDPPVVAAHTWTVDHHPTISFSN
jgi:hypothetical protein